MNSWLLLIVLIVVGFAVWCSLLWMAVEYHYRKSGLKAEHDASLRALRAYKRTIAELEKRGGAA